MRKTRLNNFVSETASSFLLYCYKEAKKTHDIETILSFKSFVKRMIEAQNEYYDGKKVWADVDGYINAVLKGWSGGCAGALDFIVKVTNDKIRLKPFNYRRKNDLLKLL